MTVGFWFCRSTAQLSGDWICRASDAIRVLQVSKLTPHDAPSVCANLTGERCTVKKEVDVCNVKHISFMVSEGIMYDRDSPVKEEIAEHIH